MAKIDFCFTYYDGDAARDMAHMSRLERGAYSDIIISQRKFGHLTIEQIKKILGRDFEDCFEAIELVMKKDVDGKYYIEWLDISILDSKKHAGHQSEKGKRGGRPKSQTKADGKPDETQTKAEQNPNKSQTKAKQKPLEDEDVYEDIDSMEDGLEETKTVAPETFHVNPDLSLDSVVLEAIERNQFTQTKSRNTDYVHSQWGVFLHERMADPPERQRQYRKPSDLTSHFINWMRNKFPKHATDDKTRNSKNAGAFQLLESLRGDFTAG